MAIQIGGTTVIDNNRNLVNIASGAGDAFPPVINFGSPTTTITSSQTFNKPGSLGDNDWIMFYLVGAGGGGRSYSSTSSTPGAGGSAVLINMFGRNMPSSVSIVIGSGGAGGNTSVNGGDGGDSTITFGSTVLTAVGGFGGRASSDSRQAGVIRLVQPGDPNQFDVDPVSAEGGALRFYIPNALFNSVYGGSTGGHYYSGVLYAPGVSTYGGTGGLGSSSGTASAGAVPGGGGGGGYGGSSSGTTSGAGGNGNCRIYY